MKHWQTLQWQGTTSIMILSMGGSLILPGMTQQTQYEGFEHGSGLIAISRISPDNPQNYVKWIGTYFTALRPSYGFVARL